MFNLILKDFRNIKRILILGIIYSIFFFSVMRNFNEVKGINFVIITLYTLFMTYFSISSADWKEEINKSSMFINTLPLSKKDIVTAKYLSIIAYTLFYYLICYVPTLIYNKDIFKEYLGLGIKNLIICLIINMILFSLYYPLYFKHGTNFLQKFRFIGFIGIFLITSALEKVVKTIDVKSLTEIFNWLEGNEILMVIMAILVTFIITVLTLNASIKIYSNKDY